MKYSVLLAVIFFGIGTISCKSNEDKCSECPTFSKWNSNEQKQV
jgi:endonuclease III